MRCTAPLQDALKISKRVRTDRSNTNLSVWRIGEGPAAPRFTIVAQPNDWTKTVAEKARAVQPGALSDARLLQLDYWAASTATLNEGDYPSTARRRPARPLQ